MSNTEGPFSLYIVEDDPPTRERLVDTVQNDARLTVEGSAGDLAGAEADWRIISQCHAALIDLGLPDGDGVDLIARLTSAPHPPSVLVISVFGDERHVVRAIEAGACGYLLKDSNDVALADAIVRTIHGESPISPSIARHLLKKFHRTPEQAHTSPITERETEVLTLIARGYSNGEVARLLDLSTNTVTSHTKSIYRKLAVNSRGEAVFEATQLGLLSVPRPNDEKD